MRKKMQGSEKGDLRKFNKERLIEMLEELNIERIKLKVKGNSPRESYPIKRIKRTIAIINTILKEKENAIKNL